ncbi:MAG: penicillin-binding protein 2 [Coriobacteriales bacterium]|nr:penicillin-binding protein 2 [Coriobacteriales bacterium]
MARENNQRGGRRRSNEASYDEAQRRKFGDHSDSLGYVFKFLAVALAIVIIRLFYLQVIEGPHNASMAVDRRTVAQPLQARRGTIYDRNGNVLATSEECYDVYANPLEITDPKAVAVIVARYLGGDEHDYIELLSQKSSFVYIKRQADKQLAEEMRAEIIKQELGGIYLLQQMRRVYPYGAVCGQILGKVNVDGEGVTGLEYTYDHELAGINGSYSQEMGYGGIPIAGVSSERTEPIDGDDLVLSIDIDIQKYVEEQMAAATVDNEAESGFCMVSDPRSGEILAACSTPYADLTQPDLITSDSLNLKVVSSSYEPGSIFKVLTAAIGIESGTVKSDTYMTVPPTVLVGQSNVYDEDGRWDYSEMNLREVLRRSSNVGIAIFAQELIGSQAFAQGVESFGIGQLTGIDYPGEAQGLVKSLQDYDPSSLGSMSFGQGLSIPMVQMVRAVGSIANGGTLYTPHFATSVGGEQKEWPAGGQSVSQATAEKVTDMMCTVVEEGTATTAAVDGYDVAAKTGTGEQAENGKYITDKYLASLIGFAPAKNPELLVYVGLNETPYLAYSSAGPVFSAIMGEALAECGVLSTAQSL